MDSKRFARTPALVLLMAVLLAACRPGGHSEAADPGPAPADSVLLLVRSDDAGMTHAVNAANRQLVEGDLPLSISVLFVTPWWQETVELLRAHPDVSVGVHLALNSEWKNLRWGPAIGWRAAPTLVDENGFFFPSAQDVYDNDPAPVEVERELRAQIERALNTGLEVDYVDFHMGTVRSHPEFYEIARRLASEYDLLISGESGETFHYTHYRADPADKPDSLATMVRRIQSRFNVVVTHPGLANPEMLALVDMNTGQPLSDVAHHRQGELDALLSTTFRQAVERRGVRLITYRELRALVSDSSGM